MNPENLAVLIPIITIVMAIGYAMLKAYYNHKEKMMHYMSGDQIAELEQMSKIADILDQRAAVLERILDSEVPDWRERNE